MLGWLSGEVWGVVWRDEGPSDSMDVGVRKRWPKTYISALYISEMGKTVSLFLKR